MAGFVDLIKKKIKKKNEEKKRKKMREMDKEMQEDRSPIMTDKKAKKLVDQANLAQKLRRKRK